MKKVILAFFALSSSTYAIPVLPSSLLAPSPAALQQACDEGFADGEGTGEDTFGRYAYLVSPDPGQAIILQMSQGSAYSICTRRGRELQQKGTVGLSISPVVAVLGGTVPGGSLKDAEKWAAALSFQDAAGKEVIRITPTDQKRGELANWKSKCSGGLCSWSGSNTYTFDLSKIPAATKTTASTAKTVVLLVNYGNGIQRYPLDTAMLNQLP